MRKLHLGAGNNILEGYVNLDGFGNKAEVIHNLNNFPYPFKDLEFDEVYMSHVLEHLDNPYLVLEEIYRILKNKGILKIIVPYYNCQGNYQDLTHKHAFTKTTFELSLKDDEYGSKHYGYNFKYKILKNELIPTNLGKLIPSFMRHKLSIIIGEVIKEIDVELEKQ